MTFKGYIDAHCHLADPQFQDRLDAVLEKSGRAGISEWIQGGVGPEDWSRQLEISKRWPKKVHLAFGLHPWWISKNPKHTVEAAFDELKRKLAFAEFLGEVGLDYMPKYKSSKDEQMEYFEKQLELNKENQMPLVLHVVHAHSDALAVLKRSEFYGGLVHSFSEGKEILKQYLDLGFLISIGPAVTRPGYLRLKEAIPSIPLSSLVLETDSPDSKGSEPTELFEVAKKVCELRAKESVEELLSISTHNLQNLINRQRK